MSPQIVVTDPLADAPSFATLNPAIERVQINCSWLIKLRWAGGLGQLITVLFVRFVLGIELPMLPLLGLIALQMLTNLALQFWIVPEWLGPQLGETEVHADSLLASVLAVDILLLSGLLYFSGGPGNPFSIFYLVNIALAGVLLRPRWAVGVSVMAIVCYSLLSLSHVSIPDLGEPKSPAQFQSPEAMRLASQRLLFQQGMFVALTTCAAFIVYFVARVTHELTQRETQLSRAQRARAETDKLEALGTLAAGAAHELATPLSTIAVVAKELEKDLEARGADQDVIGDAKLIRNEVGHCRRILDVMASDAGQTTGETPEMVSVEQLLKETREGLSSPGPARTDLFFDDGVAKTMLLVPRQGMAQALRGLFKNGLDASPQEGHIRVHASRDEHSIVIRITDSGQGMPPDVLQRAGNPFFTTKEPGRGMGLGLFLARKVLQRQRGTLRIESMPGQGTTITAVVPLPAE